jgi:hypothetical protein
VTTKDSPLPQLKAQADKIASMLKAAERGEVPPVPFGEKLLASRRSKPSVRVGIIMDDKALTPDIPWSTIRELSEADLSEWIVNQMREHKP